MELIVLHVIIWGSLLCPRLGFLLTPACGRRGTTTAKYSVENVGETPLVLNPAKPTAHDIHTGRDPARVRIFDTTLRDGEQSPGCTMNYEEKLVVAKQLAKLGVDVIEAGFPVSSRGDFEAVSQIAQVVGNGDNAPIICGLARSVKNDIKVCYDAVRHAKFHRLHLFIATSDIHMKHKLKKSKEEVLQTVSDMVAYGATLFSDIEFSAEDALRSDPRFLYQVYSTAIAAGATTINVPDTVGYSTPTEYNQLIKGLRSNVRGIDDVTISVHGHNDLGLAVANYMSAVEAGARQLECTVNGIGERAGNAALEELAMILHVRKAYYNRFFGRPETCQDPLTNINLKDIAASSRLVSCITGMQVQANKAIVGANAFAHESGIHQDGMLKNKRTYEIMDAESIGLSNNNLVLGKHSGRHAFRSRLTELGHNLSDAELNAAFLRFKALADKKKQISSADIESIVTDEIQMVSRKRFRLEHVQVQCGDKQVSTATVTISDQEATSHADVAGDATVRGGSDSIRVIPGTAKVSVTACQTGTGPVDAVYKTIDLLVAQLLAPATVSTEASPSNRAVAAPVQLLEYIVSSVTAGIDALGEVTVRCKDVHSGRTATGRAANTDVIVASAQAYLNAINRLIELQPEPAATQLIVEKNVDYAV